MKNKTSPKRTLKKDVYKKNNNLIKSTTYSESKRSEFRLNKKNGHPTYIYAKIGNKYRYIGITHSPFTFGLKNIELESNPNPKDSSKSYLLPHPQIEKTKNFKTKKSGWKFIPNDMVKVKRIINSKKK